MIAEILIKLIGVKRYFNFKNRILRIVERRVLPDANISYSQFGEDMLLNFYFLRQDEGFYIDIGAYHPIHLSNTYHFYKKGWRGINIDATPGIMKRFNEMRPRDINIECAVGCEQKEIDLYIFDMSAVNTITSKGLEFVKETFDKKPIAIVKVQCKPLSVLLNNYLPAGITEIDFMTIDTEGADEEVLRSNDWDRYRPKFICVEDHLDMGKLQNSSILNFLKDKEYELSSKLGPTNFFVSVKPC
ncbi:MAG: FkbM family methyltransferase [Ferruginibacter sp.]|nr:FkbM family methyltransferase [Ferruginibacter sp.]